MNPQQQTPIDLTGYSILFVVSDPVIPINTAKFQVMKYAASEADAIALMINDMKEVLEKLKEKADKLGNVGTLSPFVAVKKK